MMQTSDCESQPTILWHDYETWGVSPKYDKPSQFAGIRTDLELNIIGEPEMFYCQPPVDYLPHPEACLVTGITPQKAQAEGLTEAEFAARIQALFSQPNTCVAGYNNIRFDDEVSRYLFYRNFYDPYAYSWQNGNSRWYILDMVRACYALRPEGINWPVDEEGKLQVFADGNDIDTSTVAFSGALATDIGLAGATATAVTVNSIDVTTVGGSQESVAILDAALKNVDSHRAELGAFQNRFNHAINNLDNINENVNASKSRIKDTDFAKETTALTKSQILSQASSSVLAQAKQAPQAALSLLG